MSTMGRQEQTTPEQTTVTELWAGQAAMHGASLCPPEPAHQRALSLLPMDVPHDSAGCASMDKKRQARASGGKKRNDHHVLVSAQRPSGRIGDLAAQKKARKKHKRTMQSRDDITIFPRRKAGQDKLGSNRPPIVISRTVLESYFNMPQQKVCEKLGICATVIKKACRQLGIDKWPFKGNKITLRKQGVCHDGKRARGREECEDESPAVSIAFGAPAAHHAAAAQLHAAGAPGHLAMMGQGSVHLAQGQPGLMRQLVSQVPLGRRGVEETFPSLLARSQPSGIEPSLASGPLCRRPRMDGLAPDGGHMSSSLLLTQDLPERAGAVDWRMGAHVYGWESRAFVPGVAAARQQQPPTEQGPVPADAVLVLESSPPIASQVLNQGGDDAKFAPAKGPRPAGPRLTDSGLAASTGVEDEEEDPGLDLSWLVPSEPCRSSLYDAIDNEGSSAGGRARANACDRSSLYDAIDNDLMERFRTPFYHEN